MSKTQNGAKRVSGAWPTIIQLLIGAGLGYIVGMSIVDTLVNGEWSIAQVLLFLLGIFLALFIHINLHELGHFVFGRLAGYRLLSYRIGFLAWNYENGKMKFSIMLNKGYSGLCAMAPPEHELPPYKNGLYYAGGLLSNVLSSTIFLAAAYWYPELHPQAKILLLILAATGFALALINMLPFSSHNTPTDGKILWSMLLNRPFAQQLMDAQKMMTQLSAGMRPREIQIPELTDVSDIDGLEIVMLVYLYMKALDSDNREMALYYTNLFEQNLDRIPPHTLPPIYYELCYVSAISGDRDKAKLYYSKAGKILQNDRDVNGLRVKAYYEFYVNADATRTRELGAAALSVADKFPLRGQAEMERELVEKLLKAAEAEMPR